MRQRKPYNCTMTMGTASGSRPLSLSKKRAWADKLHTEVLFADANELWIKTWEILTRHFACKMTARGHPRRVCGPAFFFLFAPEARKVRFRPLRWAAKGSAFGICRLLKKAESLQDGAACHAVPAVPESVCRRVEKRTSPKGGILPRRRSLSRRSGGSGKRVPPRRL